MAESAFIVKVPEVERHVSHLRKRYDPSAALGVPAHITVLYPFMPPELIKADVVERVRRTVLSVAGFPFRLTEVCRFPGVVYLKPEPPEPFVSLTLALVRAFPAYPPYRDKHAGSVPHLTVAQVEEPAQTAVEDELLESIAQTRHASPYCRELTLIEDSSGHWEHMHAFSLGASAPAG